ncbi:MAG: WecB/TagA/CpsF family glycosyltransferase [Cellulosilyticum sp.]|nr:WecB/TagA/CpsF family glycosyltransferase [Cellulosilyticum sp.]MEE1071242.1 WecB/TagA/CpsF family glycosyltransferase [Cellulosilyticum sp.]
MKNKVDILGVSISNITMREATQKVKEFVKTDSFHSVYTPNPEFVMLAQDDEAFRKILNEADLVVPDGIGVVIGSKIKKTPLPERVPGYDLAQNTMKEAVKEGYKYYFFGGKPGVAEEAAVKMRETYPGIQIVGTRNGYFKPEDEAEIIADINASGANILFVCLGAPKQEKWIEANKHLMPHIRVAMGLGGSLDGMAGRVKRAPMIYQKLGLEWFYRLLKEPTRFKRMLVLPKFLVKVIFS